MADNYLENHYEEYEARKAAWLKARKLGKKFNAVKSKAEVQQNEAKAESNEFDVADNSDHDEE